MLQNLLNNLNYYSVDKFLLLDRHANVLDDFSSDTSIPIKFDKSLLPFNQPFSKSEMHDNSYIVIFNDSNKFFLMLSFKSQKEYLDGMQKLISLFFKYFVSVPQPSPNQINKSQSNVISKDEKYYLEKQFSRAIRSADTKRLDFLTTQLFKQAFPNQVEVNSNIFIKEITSLVAILTRIIIDEGVNKTAAYSLSDIYLNMDFSHIENPEYFIKKIVHDFVFLLQNSRYHSSSLLVNQILVYIHQNLYSPLYVTEIASTFNVSTEYLSSHFKSVTGTSLKKYINLEKIKESKFLLIYTDQSINDIAHKLNFSNQSHFSKVFKEIVKSTPSQFRLNK